MKTMTIKLPHHRPAESGAVLPIALIFLVILTIIGVTAMNTSVLDTMMASNTQFQTRALGDAEVLLIEGENDVETITGDSDPLNLNNGHDDWYYDATGTSTQTIDPSDWDWGFTTHSVVGKEGVYVIQYGGKEPIPGNTGGYGGSIAYGGAGGGVAGSFVHVFLVTTQADSSRNARRIVQSVYVTNDEP